MTDEKRAAHDRTVADAVSAFARFVAQISDEPGEMVDEESGLSGAQIHLIRRIVEDEVIDAEAAAKDWEVRR